MSVKAVVTMGILSTLRGTAVQGRNAPVHPINLPRMTSLLPGNELGLVDIQIVRDGTLTASESAQITLTAEPDALGNLVSVKAARALLIINDAPEATDVLAFDYGTYLAGNIPGGGAILLDTPNSESTAGGAAINLTANSTNPVPYKVVLLASSNN